MKPALLNSIYHKMNPENSSGGLRSVAENYIKKAFLLYLDALEKAGVSDLNEKVKVKTKFKDGHEIESIYKAGHHMIEDLFEAEEYSVAIDELDQNFLNACECPNKDKALMILKLAIQEVGGESIEQKSWLKIANFFESCDPFSEIEESEE